MQGTAVDDKGSAIIWFLLRDGNSAANQGIRLSHGAESEHSQLLQEQWLNSIDYSFFAMLTAIVSAAVYSTGSERNIIARNSALDRGSIRLRAMQMIGLE